MNTMGPAIFGHFLLQYRGHSISKVTNILVTPVRTKIFDHIMKVFLLFR